MTHADFFMTSLCLWREARGEGQTGMQAVACVLRNRVQKHSSTYYAQVVKPEAFSSITYHSDPQLTAFPKDSDPSWNEAQTVAGSVMAGSQPDITNGATLYYDDSISFPKTWNPQAVISVGKIGRLNLFREV